MATVSAAIVSYNSGKDLITAAKSIKENTKRYPLIIYIVDNCSTNNGFDNIKKELPFAEFIQSDKNGGFGYGHNRVLQLIKSDYHIVLNPDVVVDSDVVSDMVDFMEANPNVVMAMPDVCNSDGSRQYLPKRTPRLKYLVGGRLEKYAHRFGNLRAEYTMRDEYKEAPFEIEFCTGCFMLIRTEIFKKIGGFDDRFFMYFEDADLTRRAMQYGSVMMFPEGKIVHHWCRASSKKLKFFVMQISSMFKYFWKWKGKGNQKRGQV